MFFSLLLFAGGDFATENDASPEGVTESAGLCSSGIADRFAGHLTGTCGEGRLCAIVVY